MAGGQPRADEKLCDCDCEETALACVCAVVLMSGDQQQEQQLQQQQQQSSTTATTTTRRAATATNADNCCVCVCMRLCQAHLILSHVAHARCETAKQKTRTTQLLKTEHLPCVHSLIQPVSQQTHTRPKLWGTRGAAAPHMRSKN